MAFCSLCKYLKMYLSYKLPPNLLFCTNVVKISTWCAAFTAAWEVDWLHQQASHIFPVWIVHVVNGKYLQVPQSCVGWCLQMIEKKKWMSVFLTPLAQSVAAIRPQRDHISLCFSPSELQQVWQLKCNFCLVRFVSLFSNSVYVPSSLPQTDLDVILPADIYV